MPHHRLLSTLVALVAAASLLLALAGACSAMPADNGPAPATAARAIGGSGVRETVVRSANGPGTLGFVAIGVAAAGALLGAGYLGARIAVRHGRLHPS
jgi:hypothetical protein